MTSEATGVLATEAEVGGLESGLRPGNGTFGFVGLVQ
jgi:hypothetical protein